MKKCYACGKKAGKENSQLFIRHLDRDICKKCFLRNMEKRVKKHLGRERFKKGDTILVAGELEKFLVEKITRGMPLKIVFRKRLPKKPGRFDWIITGKTMDKVGGEFLGGLFKRELRLGKAKEKFFNILEPLTEAELGQYAKLKEIDFETGEGKNKERGLLEILEQQGFKEIKYNLYKNIKELRKP